MKIKEKHKTKIVGFNNSISALGERIDLHILAEIGIKSGDKSILELFITLPTLEQVATEKKNRFLSENLEQAEEITVSK